MIVADVPPDARIAQEEIFGPVLAVLKAARPRRGPARSPTARRTP